jgi:hypothetical protein
MKNQRQTDHGHLSSAFIDVPLKGRVACFYGFGPLKK